MNADVVRVDVRERHAVLDVVVRALRRESTNDRVPTVLYDDDARYGAALTVVHVNDASDRRRGRAIRALHAALRRASSRSKRARRRAPRTATVRLYDSRTS